MNVLRSVSAAVVMLMVIGCGGESTQDKFMRIAKERSMANKQAKEREKATAKARANEKDNETSVADKKPAAEQVKPAGKAPNQNEAVATLEPKAENSALAEEADSASAPAKAEVAIEKTLPTRDKVMALDRVGKRVAFAGINHTIGVYDVETKSLERKIYNPTLTPFSLAVGEQGKSIAAGGINGGFKVFSLESIKGLDRFQQNRIRRQEAMPVRKAHQNPVTAIAVNDSAGIVATGDSLGEIRIWTGDSSPPVKLTGGGSGFIGLLPYPEDRFLFGICKDSVSFWNIANNQTQAKELSVLRKPATTMAPVPGGKGLAIGDEEGHVTLWTPDGKQLRKDSFQAHQSPIVGMGFSGERKELITVSDSGDIAKWRLPVETATIDLVEKLGHQLSAAAVASNGEFVAVVEGTGDVRLISLSAEPKQDLQSEGTTFHALTISPQSTSIAAIGRHAAGNKLVLWDISEPTNEINIDLIGESQQLCFSNDGSLVAVGFQDSRCDVFDAASGEHLESTEPVNDLEAIAFTRDGTKLMLGKTDGSVSLQPLLALGRVKASETAIVSLNLHAEGGSLLCGTMGGEMTLWDRAALKTPRATLQGTAAPIVHSKISMDDRYALAVYAEPENSTYVWDLENTGSKGAPIEPKLIVPSDVGISCAAFTSDSKFLLLGKRDGKIRAWSLDEDREVASFRGHKGEVVDISPSENPSRFVSGGVDNSVHTWHFPKTLSPLGATASGTTVPKGSLADSTEIRDLTPPEIQEDNSSPGLFDAARQALIAGASTSDVLKLMGVNEKARDIVLQSLKRVRNLENEKTINSTALSKERRRLTSAQRDIASSEEAQNLSSYVDGFSNLSFVAKTNFNFAAEAKFRPARLLFADRFIYAARTSVGKKRTRDRDEEQIDEGDNGALLSWDYRFSRLQTHAWSIEDLDAKEIFALPDSAGVFSIPQMMFFGQEGSSRVLGAIKNWAISSPRPNERQFLAVGTEGALREESDILKIFDIRDLDKEEVSPYSQYRSFEGVVTAIAFANHSQNLAFCVRERAAHRLFIADAETLRLQEIEVYNHQDPWGNPKAQGRNSSVVIRASTRGRAKQGFAGSGLRSSSGSNSSASMGITSLAFSADDKTLVAHGPYEADMHRFTRWRLSWDEEELISFSKKWEQENERAFFVDTDRHSMRFVTRADGTDGGYKRLLIQNRKGFSVVNINSQKSESEIEFLKTQHGTPEYAVSKDGRWLLMGDDNGMAYVFNTLNGKRYSVTTDEKTEELIQDPRRRASEIVERPAHTGPIVGVAFSDPDPGQDYPAFAATIGEENKLKIWELFPILHPESGIRSRR